MFEGKAENGILHLINSGSAALDGTGEQELDGKPAMKPFWEITDEEVDRTLKATQWRPANLEYFRGGGYSTDYLTRGGMPMTMFRLNLVKGLGPVPQIAEGYSVDLPAEVHDTPRQANRPDMANDLVCAESYGTGCILKRL